MARPIPGTKASSGLTVYPLPVQADQTKQSTRVAAVNEPDVYTTLEGEDSVPDYQRAIARSDGREDEEYYKDVENITSRYPGSFRSNPLGFMIRLSAESTAFYQGSGWRSYEEYVGAPIFYPTYTQEIRNALINSERMKAAIMRSAKGLAEHEQAAEGQESGKQKDRAFARILYRCHQQAQRTAISYMDSLIADMSNMTMIRFVAFIVNNILVRMYNQGIHIKESEFVQVRKAAEIAEKKKQSILFLPCHKSHVDYLVISYIFYRLGIALPHIAAGDNLNLPVAGWILRHGGAFFIRRSFGDDPMYQELVKEYIELLLRRGHNIEVFIEGTRSRTGKLLAPRFGILKIALEAVLAGRVEDCIIVPMSIGYDRVIETETYVNELLGTPKTKESLAQILNSASLLRLKLGRIDIRFAQPYSLRQWIDDEVVRRSSPMSLFSPMFSPYQKSVLLQSLGFRILSDINAVGVIMPSALVGTAVLTLRGRGVGRSELIRRVTWLRREILIKGGRVADFSGQDVGSIVDRAVQTHAKLIGIRKDLLEPVFYALKRFELSLYRNQVIHLFIQEAIVAAAMYATVKKGQTHRRIRKSVLMNDVKFLSQLFKGEFIYRPGSAEENTEDTLWILKDHNVIDLEYEDGSSVAPPLVTEAKSPHPEFRELLVKLTDRERSIGRENFDFYCFLIWPFLETYWLAAVGLFCLLPTPRSGGFTERVMMDRLQAFGKTLYYEGDLGYFESISKETIRNALRRYQDLGLLITRKSIPSQQPLPGMTKPDQPPVTLYAIAPDIEKEVMLFWDKPIPSSGTPYQYIYSFTTDIHADVQMVPPATSHSRTKASSIYETRLWDIVETIGKYRREGKHRRDNQITGQRTLRLARMTWASTVDKANL